MERFKAIGFFDSARNTIIYDYLFQQKFRRRDQLPITGIIKEIVQSDCDFHAWRNSATIGKEVKLNYLNGADTQIVANLT